MASVDKLLKFISAKNTAELLDEDQCKEIAEQVVKGYQIDDKSRASWLQANQEAVKIIKHYEDGEVTKDFPFNGASKVIFPLISPAIIQLSSRMIQHVVRNDTVGSCAVLGEDKQPEIDILTQQPTGMGVKAAKAKRVGNFLNYELLIKSDEWLTNEHKLNTIVAGWGTGFKMVYYDRVAKSTCHEVLPPEDVIINHNTVSLEKCRRITVRQYLTKNNIIERIRSEEFCDVDFDKLDSNLMDNVNMKNDTEESTPVYEVLQQFCYLDLDDDGYEEPYTVWVHNQSKTMLGMYPAYDMDTINPDDKGNILSIKYKQFIVDRHLINDPEGKFYSLGLNALLLHQNKSLTAVLRQLIDAGTLANTAGSSGFVTKAFKTKEKNMRMQMGVFKEVDIGLGSRLQDNIMNAPFKEPSQVLLSLLQFLSESGKETGYMTDILTGDNQMQNVPATTSLAMIEQATRAFKPVVQKMQASLKKEFKLWFDIHSEYMDEIRNFAYYGEQIWVQPEDFDKDSFDISPVADPTMSSEAHLYARLQAAQQFAQIMPQAVNAQELALRFFTELQYSQPEKLISQPQAAPPDPKVMKVQLDAQVAQMDQKNKELEQQLKIAKLELDKVKLQQKQQEINIHAKEADVGIRKTIVEAHNQAVNSDTQKALANISAYNAETDRIKAHKEPKGGK